MTRVVSFKVEDEIYDKLKGKDLSFREIFTPLVETYLNINKQDEYTPRIRSEGINECKHLSCVLNQFEQDLSCFLNGLNEMGQDNNLFLLFARLVEYDLEIIRYIQLIIDIQLNNSEDQKEPIEKIKAKQRQKETLPTKGKKGFNAVENLPPHNKGKTRDNSTWEEG